ncbi:hypothetical protein L218DRAFT_950111 [Marasmius fiardii PR-910]|nr:hypothetical protein L218DRAFT_950111 [Marasmius fiardii PR-910]
MSSSRRNGLNLPFLVVLPIINEASSMAIPMIHCVITIYHDLNEVVGLNIPNILGCNGLKVMPLDLGGYLVLYGIGISITIKRKRENYLFNGIIITVLFIVVTIAVVLNIIKWHYYVPYTAELFHGCIITAK